MDVEGLFKTLADYLNFTIDFLLLRGFEKYARMGKVSPELVSYFVVGVLVAYLIASMRKPPGYADRVTPEDRGEPEAQATPAPRGEGKEGGPDPLSGQMRAEMAQFALMSVVFGMLFHVLLVVFNWFFGGEIGTVKDTLNAIFAVNAAYNPLNALLKQAGRVADVVAPISLGWRLLAGAVHLLAAAVHFGCTFYWLYALSTVHGTSVWYILGPVSPFVVLGIVLAVVILLSGRRKAG
jgi:hypothetical protein